MRLIDADALEREYQERYKLFTWDDGEREKATLVGVIQMLHAQPTIEERKTGKWLPDNNSVYEMRFVCSECKESQVVPTIGFTKYNPIWDFCPLCGARMEGDT